MSYFQHLTGSNSASVFSAQPGRRTLLDPMILSPGENQDGNVTLVVVDMQPGFRDAIDQATLDAVERQIKLAISRNWAIVLLENEPWRNGPTLPQLMKHLQDERGNWTYKRAFMRVKSTDSGAAQVVEACEDFGYPMQYFRACGVYLDACVEKTVLGILKRLPCASLRCIRQAMNTNYLVEGAWAAFPVGPHLVVSSESVDSESPISQPSLNDESATEQPRNPHHTVPVLSRLHA
jgi:hypothetical protein